MLQDTVRRRMQMKGKIYDGVLHALRTIAKEEGFLALYKGWWANTLKVVPQNAIRFVSYEFFKKLFQVSIRTAINLLQIVRCDIVYICAGCEAKDRYLGILSP